MRDELEREYVEYFQLRMPHLRRLAATLCGDTHRGDDIVQSAVTTLYMRWKQVRDAGDRDRGLSADVVRCRLAQLPQAQDTP